jgi:hypothetical protein
MRRPPCSLCSRFANSERLRWWDHVWRIASSSSDSMLSCNRQRVPTTITTRASVSSFDWATVKPRSGRELLTAPVWATALSDHRQGDREPRGEPSRSSILPGEFHPRPTAPRGLQCCLLLRAPEAGRHQSGECYQCAFRRVRKQSHHGQTAGGRLVMTSRARSTC